MPMRTNGVYQDKSVPGGKKSGCGEGVVNRGPTNPGMGGDTQKPGYPSYAMATKSSHDDKGNSSYSR